jgi:hypothetical protein
MSCLVRIFHIILAVVAFGAAGHGMASQIQFNLGQNHGELPPGLASLVSGEGKPGEWKILDEVIPPTEVPLIPGANTATIKQSVLAQTAQVAATNHAPLLLFTNETIGDFTVTTRLKILRGTIAPEAGIAFRAQNQSNYYVVRASTQGNLLWYRVVNGVRYEGQGIGVRIPVSVDTWQDLRIECFGNQIRCYWNGKLAIPPARADAPTNGLAINDSTFASGKVGFWTDADTVAYFTDTKIDYTSRVPFIQNAVAGVMEKYPRLLGLKVYEIRGSATPILVADGKEKDLGSPGGKTETDVINTGTTMYLKSKNSVELTMPLRDRNGDIVAAVKTTMTTFPGETTDTSATRAIAVKNELESRLNTLQDINQ